MIIRVFTAEVPLELHNEFEEKFKAISVPLVNSQHGLLNLEIARPTTWNPKTYLMVSKWATKEDIINFAGQNWNQAHIPAGMEKYIESCTIAHFVDIPI
ncbi:antibiotic biosynthesis monooxygenase family protein [Flagellimonas flava]|uniref:Antibiotic biosynthesis monooxygenase n=1 Tax=Flagellimonas flava TaxID=570519 RepID=A0A1M5P1G7_9FLAO|nr:antibiotic biosynthesis monooxygenase [Allomuricauda flava]SHG95033.1 Antibiotic biosynthesis monooxygenase [Allomuricauda flava]